MKNGFHITDFKSAAFHQDKDTFTYKCKWKECGSSNVVEIQNSFKTSLS